MVIMNNLKMELAGIIDHTLLKPYASVSDIENLCREAVQMGYFSVCVNGCWVQVATEALAETEVRVAAVVGFPLGAMDADVKRYETEVAIDEGAEEIDVVINVGRLKSGDFRSVHRELRDIVEAADERLVKVIIETCYLTDEEKKNACRIASEAGAHFVKTSTGFGEGGARVEDIQLMAEAVKGKLGVKASGGIRDTMTALKMIQAGATRLGLSSSKKIIDGLEEADVQAWLQQLAQLRIIPPHGNDGFPGIGQPLN